MLTPSGWITYFDIAFELDENYLHGNASMAAMAAEARNNTINAMPHSIEDWYNYHHYGRMYASETWGTCYIKRVSQGAYYPIQSSSESVIFIGDRDEWTILYKTNYGTQFSWLDQASAVVYRRPKNSTLGWQTVATFSTYESQGYNSILGLYDYKWVLS